LTLTKLEHLQYELSGKIEVRSRLVEQQLGIEKGIDLMNKEISILQDKIQVMVEQSLPQCPARSREASEGSD